MSSTGHTEIRERLAEIAEMRAEFKRLRVDAAELAAEWVPAAASAGVPLAEIARLSGMSRQAVYNVLDGRRSWRVGGGTFSIDSASPPADATATRREGTRV